MNRIMCARQFPVVVNILRYHNVQAYSKLLDMKTANYRKSSVKIYNILSQNLFSVRFVLNEILVYS